MGRTAHGCRKAAFEERAQNSRLIMVSHSVQTIRDYCQTGAILHNGRLTCFDDIEQAIKVYHEILQVPVAPRTIGLN